jgi:ketosteroid isomerase-like protein
VTDESRNVEILKLAYSRWSDSRGKDVDAWMSICADGIAFGTIAQREQAVPYMAAYSQRDQLRQYFDGINRDWEMIEYVPEHFVAQGDRVVMLGRCAWRAKANGQVVSTPKADSFRLRDGKIVEYFEYFDTAQVRDAMTWSPAAHAATR